MYGSCAKIISYRSERFRLIRSFCTSLDLPKLIWNILTHLPFLLFCSLGIVVSDVYLLCIFVASLFHRRMRLALTALVWGRAGSWGASACITLVLRLTFIVLSWSRS